MSYSLLTPLAVGLEDAAEHGRDIGASPYVFGGFALFVLVALLVTTIILGKGRPHS